MSVGDVRPAPQASVACTETFESLVKGRGAGWDLCSGTIGTLLGGCRAQSLHCVLTACSRCRHVQLDAAASLVEQRPRWVLVPRGQSRTLQCILRDAQYPWMSWYQQDLQGQLQSLASLRSPGDEEAVSRPGADYLATRVSDMELTLRVANVTQGRTLFCTCTLGKSLFCPDLVLCL
uniref:Immunoglobulin V-set domain-containing protein n=1 Tax=Oryctolagus cuniculus TaxID=9986 RepID=G1TX38_RABIT